jgi:hypothetical protein
MKRSSWNNPAAGFVIEDGSQAVSVDDARSDPEELVELFGKLTSWAERHREVITSARRIYDDREQAALDK